MILWTFQPYKIYNQVIQNGEYICDPNKSPMLELDDEDNDNRFTRAYQWLIKQMEDNIGPRPSKVKVPVWAWYRWGYKHQPPNFSSESNNAITVCMKLKIPDEQVLLSDFDLWHMVLGRSYIGNATSQTEFDKEEKWFDSLSKNEAEEIMKKSWQKIFDITPNRDNLWTMNGGYVQGCFWKLKKEYICKVWRLEKGRKSYRLDLMTAKQLSKFKNI